jgi:hypothetical protein
MLDSQIISWKKTTPEHLQRDVGHYDPQIEHSEVLDEGNLYGERTPRGHVKEKGTVTLWE